MIWQGEQTKRFVRAYKKLHDNLVRDVEEAVFAVAENPDIE